MDAVYVVIIAALYVVTHWLVKAIARLTDKE